MSIRILDNITGKDDLERVAYKEDLGLLNEYLKTRRLLIPKRPRRFLDADTCTQEEVLDLIEQEAIELGGDQFDIGVLEIDGKKRLPAFSSQKKMEEFSGKMSKRLDKVFSLGCIEILLADVIKNLDVDFVDLNLFSQKSWEIGIKTQS